MFTLLIETNGPGGLYGELSRTCVIGKATDEMKEEAAFMLEARNHALKLLTLEHRARRSGILTMSSCAGTAAGRE